MNWKMNKQIDLTGQIFYNLSVIGKHNEKTIHGALRWNCMCVCGNIVIHTACNLKSGSVKSCGCKFKSLMQDAIVTHGRSNTPEYNIWTEIKQRTNNTNNNYYSNYGGRGITVCDRWKNSFINFYQDMGPRPTDLHSIDRINNEGNYEPNNCRWATIEEQANNRTTNIKYMFNGDMRTLAQIAKQTNICYENLRRRLKRGQCLEIAINEMQSKQTTVI